MPMDAADREPGGHGIETSLLPLKKRSLNYSSGGGGSSGGHGHRIETSLLPLKKRPLNYNSVGGRSSGGIPYASSSKKKRMTDNSVAGAETKNSTGALEAPVPRQQRPMPVAASREPAVDLPAPAAASPEPAAKGNALALSECDEQKRLGKGKWLYGEESSILVAPQPPAKKLMHDGIRSFIPQQLRSEHRHAGATAAPAEDGSPALSPALERHLTELGATRPWLVHSKKLKQSDVDVNQNRLLVSRKRGSGTEDCPITRCFSAAELKRVRKKDVGLWITALDRDDIPYALTCKFLRSNDAYRFISEWKRFLKRHGMDLKSQKNKVWTRDVEVELWAFRSRQLPFQPQINDKGKVATVKTRGKDGKNVLVVQRESHHLDPNGALGLLLLHHENRRRVIEGEEEEEEEDDDDDDWMGPSSPPSVARKKKGKQRSGKKRGASASRVALPASIAKQGGPRQFDPKFRAAAIGLAKLRQSIWDRRNRTGRRGPG